MENVCERTEQATESTPRELAIRMHTHQRDCWAGSGKIPWSQKHAARIVALEAGAELTEAETELDQYAMMLETIQGETAAPQGEVRLNNEELAAAIAWTSDRVRATAPMEVQHDTLQMHLTQLLAEQLRRAGKH